MAVEREGAGVEHLVDDGVDARDGVVVAVGQPAPVFERHVRRAANADELERRQRVEPIAAPTPPDLEDRAERVLGEIELVDGVQVDAGAHRADGCGARRRNVPAGERGRLRRRRRLRCARR